MPIRGKRGKENEELKLWIIETLRDHKLRHLTMATGTQLYYLRFFAKNVTFRNTLPRTEKTWVSAENGFSGSSTLPRAAAPSILTRFESTSTYIVRQSTNKHCENSDSFNKQDIVF